MSRVRHYDTTIQTIFAVEVSDDEQVPQQPIVVRLTSFTEEAFVWAYRQIKAERDKAVAAMEPELPKPVRKPRARVS